MERKKFLDRSNSCAPITDEKKYICYIRLLQQALNHSLIPRKVHEVKKLKQIKRLESHISSKSCFKTIAENDFEKDL